MAEERLVIRALGILDILIPGSARRLPLDLEPHDDIPEHESDGDGKDPS